MNEFLFNNEPVIRMGFFFGILALVVLWEFLAPRRINTYSRWTRWPSNFAIVILNTIIVRLLFPTAAVGFAIVAAENNWGLLNIFDFPVYLSILLAVMALDFVIYLQHVMFHAVPILWRLHRMHHSDLDYDVTTGARFHPLEIILSMLLKLAAIALIGAPAVAVLIFEVLLNGVAMFNHGNIQLPKAFDRILRWLVVTPDMHRVHHSIEVREANSNFGFNLPWWDRLFGTYRAQPKAGHRAMIIGINQFRDTKYLNLYNLLILPFLDRPGAYVIDGSTEEKTPKDTSP